MLSQLVLSKGIQRVEGEKGDGRKDILIIPPLAKEPSGNEPRPAFLEYNKPSLPSPLHFPLLSLLSLSTSLFSLPLSNFYL
jgi:hypothetical protein